MKPRILFILHLPPPVHGASMMGQYIRDSQAVQAAFEPRYLNLSTSERVDQIGRIGFHKAVVFLRLMRQVRREVKSFRPDLVYVTPTVCLPGFLKDWWLVRCLKERGCRIVVHLHNKGAMAWKDRGWAARLYRRFFSGIRVILLSERLYPDIAPYASRDRVSICPNGIPPLVLPTSSERSVPRLLFFSNLIPSKGVEVLLDSCVLLRRKGIPFSCDFAGACAADYPEERFRQAVESRDLAGCVRYLGRRTGVEKEKVFAEADVFVFPTYYPLECFPLVILEAMSAGLPVVSTREGGIPDMIVDGETGILCPPKDADATAHALERLLEDPELRKQMGRKGREAYAAKFTDACFERRFVAVLEEVISS